MYAKITDHPSLIRDMSNQHILQTDGSVVRKHDAREKAFNAARARDAELAVMKKDIGEIKEMLQSLQRLLGPPPGSTGIGAGGTSYASWIPPLGYDPRQSFTVTANTGYVGCVPMGTHVTQRG